MHCSFTKTGNTLTCRYCGRTLPGNVPLDIKAVCKSDAPSKRIVSWLPTTYSIRLVHVSDSLHDNQDVLFKFTKNGTRLRHFLDFIGLRSNKKCDCIQHEKMLNMMSWKQILKRQSFLRVYIHRSAGGLVPRWAISITLVLLACVGCLLRD